MTLDLGIGWPNNTCNTYFSFHLISFNVKLFPLSVGDIMGTFKTKSISEPKTVLYD